MNKGTCLILTKIVSWTQHYDLIGMKVLKIHIYSSTIYIKHNYGALNQCIFLRVECYNIHIIKSSKTITNKPKDLILVEA
jgi:hypothetical protein